MKKDITGAYKQPESKITTVKTQTTKKKLPKEVMDSCQEVKDWEAKILKPSGAQKVLEYADRPIKWVFDKIPIIASEAITSTIEGLFGLMLFTSYYTFSNKTVLRNIEKRTKKKIESREDVWKQSLPYLKDTASSYITENNIIAALEGGATGMGGAILIAVDIPALFGIAFRTIQQIGESFGFDMESVNEKRFVMSIIDLASGVPTAGKVQLILGNEALKNYAKKTAFKEMEEIAAIKMGQRAAEKVARGMLKAQGTRATKKAVAAMTSKIMRQVTKDGTKAVALTTARNTAKDAGVKLTKRKIGQLLPFIGAFIGAGFNFWFIWSIGETAYYSYLKRHLHERYGLC